MERSPATKQPLNIIGLTLFLSGLAALFIWQFNFFLLIFSSVLMAVLFHYVASWIVKKTKLKYPWALTITLLFIALLITGFILLAGPSLSKQIDEISETLPKSVDELKKQLESHPLGKRVLKQVPDDPGKAVSENKEVLAAAAGYISSFLGVLGNVVIVLIAAIFFATAPRTYAKGIVRLFPPENRPKAMTIIQKIYKTLSTWLAAKFVSMTVVGVATGIGLMLLGAPLALILAVIAAAFTFIPYIGPYLALVPAVLVGLIESSQLALYITILYFSIQIVESYFITPMIEKKMVELPPALALFFQVLLGIIAGPMGLLLASPILAALIVLVRETYIKKIEKADNELLPASPEINPD